MSGEPEAPEPETPEPEDVPAGAEPEAGRPISVRAERGARMTPSEAVRDMRITLPARGNRTLRDLIDRVNRDTELKALWHAANVNAVTRLQINDHSWVHIQIVTNIGLKLLRELRRAGVEPGMVADYGMTKEDSEVVVVLGCLTHCLGMAIHRTGHEDMSLFLAADRMPRLLEGLYEEPELTIIQAEVLQTIISHRSDGVPLSVGRARHGQGPLAHPVRVGPRLDPLALGRGDRGGADQGRRRPRQDRDRDEQFGRPLPGRQPASVEASRVGSRGADRGRGQHLRRVREAPPAAVSAVADGR
jgi:hypothetical protein